MKNEKRKVNIGPICIAVGAIAFAAGFLVPRAIAGWSGTSAFRPSDLPTLPAPRTLGLGGISSGAIYLVVPEGTAPVYAYTEREGAGCTAGLDAWLIPAGSILVPAEVEKK